MLNPILQQIKSHFDKIITDGKADFGPDPNSMWMASLDVRTGKYPDPPPDDENQRIHHYAHAPGGVNAYWDQPHLVAAHVLSQIIGDLRYAEAVDSYLRDFLQRSISYYDLFLWGDHYYYHTARGEVVMVAPRRPPEALQTHRITGFLNELRPITPAWELFWQVDPAATERCIRAMGSYHIVDTQTGAYNHHADQQAGYNFLETGAVLVESLAWLYAKTQDTSLHERALRIATFSFDSRNQDTGLLPVASVSNRWDEHTSTTEVGLWAMAMIRAAAYTNDQTFRDMAQNAVSAYLLYGWDSETERYFGRLNTDDGTPQRDLFEGEDLIANQPRAYSDIWNGWFPSHDYPLALAEVCCALYEHSGQHEFEIAIHRWGSIIHASLAENTPPVRYAEHFGRAIHFLLRASKSFVDQPYRMWAAGLADEAIDLLFAHDMFRSNTSEDRYHAVDGMGFLLLALMELETNQPLELMGLGF